jgi:DNA polymerase III sliding clamp (beta) subunit (PCNA family)
MATKVLTDLDWVKLAASRDDGRPVLNGIHVETQELGAWHERTVATDAYRLHMVESACNFKPGLYDARTGQPIEGKFPSVDQIIPGDEPWLTVQDFGGIYAITSAAIAATRAGRIEFVTLPAGESEYGTVGVALSPTYLLDALKGAVGKYATGEVRILTQGPLQPVKVVIAPRENGGAHTRTALLMPTRRGHDGPDARFDLSAFVAPKLGSWEFVPALAGEVAA